MSNWVDLDDAASLTVEITARAEPRIGGKVVLPATGTYTRDTSPQAELTRR